MADQPQPTPDLQLPRDPFAATVINVKHYGAKGESTDDTIALQTAIKVSRDGDALYFPPGTYLVNEPLQPKAHQLYFSLTGATLKARRHVTGFPMFIIRSGPVEFRHLTIDGANDETTGPEDPAQAPGIWHPANTGRAVNVVVTACWLRKAHGDGIHIAGGPQADRASDRVIVRDTVVEQCGMYGLGCGRVANVRVESSRFERCASGVKMFDCDDVVVHAVTANANRRHGIVFLFSHRWHVGNCVTRGNGSEEDGGWGIAAGGDPSTNLLPNSDFAITSNISEDNVSGGITLDPTVPSQSEVIWPQRATISGNVCRNATQHHSIQVTHASDVVITGNVCSDNRRGSGIQVLSSSHVLVQGNMCFSNRNGIGLFSNELVSDPGYHVLGVNMLDRNDVDVRHQPIDQGQPLPGVRIHGLNGSTTPEGNVQAEPGTLFELHEGDQGALFVKEAGSETTGWRRVAAAP
jgi:hypothetical protein